MPAFSDRIESIDELRELIPPPAAPSVAKEVDRLDGHCRDLIARSPFLVVASCDAEGRCDASPKGGPPGFVHVLDDHRLAVPDYPGNRRLDSWTNVIEHGGVELLFLVPGLGETLRVRGRACLTRDAELLAALDDAGRPPRLALGVEVERCFLHCAKALRRSRLWEPEAWAPRDELPSAARIFADHIALPGVDEAAAAAHLEEDYRSGLWPR
jgi:uncharacterized protein